jgi:hypothetical protein
VEEAAIRVDGAMKTAATEVKANHMTRVPIAFNTIPRAAITAFSINSPRCNLGISRRIRRSRLINGKAFLELQQGTTLLIMA